MEIFTPGGNLSLSAITTSGFISFAPVASINEIITVTLLGGTAGTASLQGFTVHYSELPPAPVPATATVALLACGVLGLAWARRRSSQRL